MSTIKVYLGTEDLQTCQKIKHSLKLVIFYVIENFYVQLSEKKKVIKLDKSSSLIIQKILANKKNVK